MLVRGIDDALAVHAERNMVHFELARRQQRRLAAIRWHRVQARPAAALPGEHDLSIRTPPQLARAVGLVKDASRAAFRAPHLASIAALRISHADRPGLPLAQPPQR